MVPIAARGQAMSSARLGKTGGHAPCTGANKGKSTCMAAPTAVDRAVVIGTVVVGAAVVGRAERGQPAPPPAAGNPATPQSWPLASRSTPLRALARSASWLPGPPLVSRRTAGGQTFNKPAYGYRRSMTGVCRADHYARTHRPHTDGSRPNKKGGTCVPPLSLSCLTGPCR